MQHSTQDARDTAARRARDPGPPKPIRYDRDTWLVMRNDPTDPAAIITRQRGERGEYFRAVTWHLDPTARTLIGRYRSLQEADVAVLWTHENRSPGLQPDWRSSSSSYIGRQSPH